MWDAFITWDVSLELSWRKIFGANRPELGITGYMAVTARGTVTGAASGVDTGSFNAVVHWYNSAAQYWTKASSSGSFTSPPIKPGIYTMVLYQTEYGVAESSVSVLAGQTTTANTANGLQAGYTSLFKIGEYDGQPTGFLNADNFLCMHPSDSRMSSWGPVTYGVASSSEAATARWRCSGRCSSPWAARPRALLPTGTK